MSFSSDVDSFIDLADRRLKAVARQSVQELVDRAERTQPEGGRMRVDTGFLRASGGASLGSMPRGPDEPTRRRATGDKTSELYNRNESLTGRPLIVILSVWDQTQPLYYGWSANYARIRESKDGFMRLAAQNWDDIVASNARRARAVIK